MQRGIALTYVLVRLTVEDLAKWMPALEEAGALRMSFGSLGICSFRKADSPNEVTILAKNVDRAKAQEMFQPQEFREATKRRGVMGLPEVTFLN